MATVAHPALPPLSELIKSRDVEDPVNLWVHRPLAYAFVALTHRTPLMPNHVTLLAMAVGLGAGACWLGGTPGLMLAGGALLWTSSILDGADGMLARAKKVHSELGRALDGLADVVVAAATVLPGFIHVWQKAHDPLHLALAPLAIVTTWFQIYLYDYYKDCYLASVDPAWDGTSPALDRALERVRQAKEGRVRGFRLFVWRAYAGMLGAQARVIGATNPLGLRSRLRFVGGPDLARIYRRHNRAPLQIWTAVSLCPHSYLMAICGMMDRLDVYLWFRVAVANALFVTVLVWQRVASARTRRDLDALGLSPVPVGDAAPRAG